MATPVRARLHPAPRADTALAARIRAGDIAAFEQAFHTYYDGLLTFVESYVHDPAVAQEVVQDLFLSAWNHRERFARHGTPKAYLYGAARNGALLRLRRGRLEHQWRHELAQDDPPLVEPADYRVRSRDAALAASRAIDLLPAKCRRIFLMSRGHGLSTAEIAHALDMTPKSVEQQLWRALAALRKSLAPILVCILMLSR